MALTQDQRIEISKKIIDIPVQDVAFDSNKAALEDIKIKLTNEDSANKSLMDADTLFINPYQEEIAELDGNVRIELIEQNMIDGANKKKQNFFFPNDNAISLPNVSDGIWKFLTPFSGSVAIGKNYTEVFPSTTPTEQSKIDTINAVITTIEGGTAGTRSSGEECTAGSPDVYSNDATMHTALSDITTAVNAWRSFIVAEQALILTTDTNTARQAENDIAIADITATLVIIDAWLAYNDWDTTTTLPAGSTGSGCLLFDAMIPSDFVSSKLRTTELQPLKDEITARTSYIVTRASELSVNLGSVGQVLSTGVIDASGSGLYDKRYKAINVRLNLLGGSLNKLIGITNGQQAQDDMKITNAAAGSLYDSVMKVSLLKAPASNTGTIHIFDATDFSVNDVVYVVAEKQNELTGTISNIVGNTVFLSFNIPEKYTNDNLARLYRVI